MMKNLRLGRSASRTRTIQILGVLLGVVFLIALPQLERPMGIVVHFVGTPFFIGAEYAKSFIAEKGSLLRSKQSLVRENQNLTKRLSTLSGENVLLKAERDMYALALERFGSIKENSTVVLAKVIAGPLGYPFGTIIIDKGADDSLQLGELVIAENGILVGAILRVYQHSSTVRLFSASGVETEVIIGIEGPPATLQGRGAGSFELVLPKEIMIPVGTPVFLPRVPDHALTVIEASKSDPADAFQTLFGSELSNMLVTRVVGIIKGSAVEITPLLDEPSSSP